MDRRVLIDIEHPNSKGHRHFNSRPLPSVRLLRAEARGATLIVLLQMLGVWAAAWVALASAASWVR
jgi:hypothetical protein